MYTIYLTTECNFECSYCYEDYKEHLNLSSKGMKEVLNFIFNYEKDNRVRIGFMGGEPLLRKELIYQAIEYIHNKFSDRDVKYYLTTNCSLLDDDFIQMMKKNQFDVRLSFDGMKEAHNHNRREKSGTSCYDEILSNILKIRDSGIRYSVRMTVAENTIPLLYKNITFLHENGLDFISMILDIYTNLTDKLGEVYKEQLNSIADYYVKEHRAGRTFSIDQFDGKYISILGDLGNCFSMCGAGLESISIMPDGAIYPCAYLTNERKYSIGDVKGTVDREYATKIPVALFDKMSTKCKKCKIIDFCHGMKCGYMNYLSTGYINIPSDLTCMQENIAYPVIKKILHQFGNDNEILKIKFSPYIEFLKSANINLNPLGMEIKNSIQQGNES